MPSAPKSVEIRSYQVGFGDCFLLSFVYGAHDNRHMLIDFGTTGLPKRGKPLTAAKPSEHMPKVAQAIRDVCGGRPTAVVATHRRADHISGFATDTRTGKSGEIINDDQSSWNRTADGYGVMQSLMYSYGAGWATKDGYQWVGAPPAAPLPVDKPMPSSP